MATTANQNFYNFLLRRSQFLYRYENGLMKDMVAPYVRAKEELTSQLQRLTDFGQGFSKEYRIQRLQSQIQEINAILSTASDESVRGLTAGMSELAAIETESYYKMLESQFGTVGVSINRLPYRQIDFILSNPLLGEEYSQKGLWTNQKAINLMRSELTQSIIQGEDMEKVARRLIGVGKGLGGEVGTLIGRRAELIARSEVQYVSNSIARATFAENRDVLKGMMFSSTLDRRTCLRCASLDGQAYNYNEDGSIDAPLIPIHPLCRCVYVPISKSWQELAKEEGRKFSDKDKAKFSAEPLKSLAYDQWLKTLTKKGDGFNARDALGPGRYQLWKDGKIKISQMATDKEVYSIDKLEKEIGKLLEDQGLAARAKALSAEQKAQMTAKQIRAYENYVPVDQKARDIAELAERETANLIGADHIIGKRPFDMFLDNEFIEHKTFISGRGQVRIRPSSMKKKQDFVKQYKVRAHTVVLDKRPDSETFGKLFYRKGLGDYAIPNMTEVKNADHLVELLKKGARKDTKLPVSYLRVERSNTIRQAEDFARRTFGIAEIDYKGISPEVADLVNGYVGGAINNLGIKPKRIIFNDARFAIKNKRVAALTTQDGSLYLNRNFFTNVVDIEDLMKFNYKAGQFTTSSPGHIINHEIAHLRYFKLGGTEGMGNRRLSRTVLGELNQGIGPHNLKRYVSKYAMKSEGEFYAEMIAKQLNGERLHPVAAKIVKNIEKKLRRNAKTKVKFIRQGEGLSAKVEKARNEFGYNVGSRADKFIKALQEKPLTDAQIRALSWNTNNRVYDKVFKPLVKKGLAGIDNKGRKYIVKGGGKLPAIKTSPVKIAKRQKKTVISPEARAIKSGKVVSVENLGGGWNESNLVRLKYKEKEIKAVLNLLREKIVP